MLTILSYILGVIGAIFLSVIGGLLAAEIRDQLKKGGKSPLTILSASWQNLPIRGRRWLDKLRSLISGPDDIPPIGPLPKGSRMPLKPNPVFVGRESELRDIARKLEVSRTTAIGQVNAVTGLGGIGKTQLAVQYVHHYGFRYSGGVFWLNMESEDNIRNEIALCGGRQGMKLQGFEELKLDEQVETVLSMWREEKARLLVFDNVEDPAVAQKWIPSAGKARVLITSRREKWPATMGIDPLPLRTLAAGESLKLLLKDRPDAYDSKAETAAAKNICKTLGYLPLALDLARAYLGRYRHEVSIADYEKELSSQPVLNNPGLVGFVKDPSPTEHIQSIAATFDVSYDKLDKENETDALAMTLFHMVSHFAPTSISRELLGMTADLDPEDPGDRRAQADAINRLVSLALIQEEAGGRLLMHRLLREFALDRLPPGTSVDECADSFEDAMGDFANAENKSGLPAKLAAELEHLRHAANKADERESENAGRLFNQLGYHQNMVADYEGAKKNFERALEIDEKAYGPDHPNVAIRLNNLGEVLRAQGDLEGAKKNFERALEIDEKALGPDHPNVAIRLNNLGLVLQDQGDLEGARKNFERALEIGEKTHGPDHPNVAIRLNNLGGVLLAQGDLEGAKKNIERALEIDEKAFGSDHPDVARDLNNLGLALKAQGDLEGAKKNIERALEIFRKFLGDEHPDTETVRKNLEYLDSLVKNREHE